MRIQDIVAIAYAILGVYWAYWLHTRLFTAYGARRFARFVAYVGGAWLVCSGLGLMRARLFGGWHVVKGSGFETHTSVRDGLMFGVFGAIAGVVCFWRSEMNGGQMFFEWIMPEEIWGDYTRRILAIEAIASVGDRRRTARFLDAIAARTAEELTPELRAYVTRNERG